MENLSDSENDVKRPSTPDFDHPGYARSRRGAFDDEIGSTQYRQTTDFEIIDDRHSDHDFMDMQISDDDRQVSVLFDNIVREIPSYGRSLYPIPEHPFQPVRRRRLLEQIYIHTDFNMMMMMEEYGSYDGAIEYVMTQSMEDFDENYTFPKRNVCHEFGFVEDVAKCSICLDLIEFDQFVYLLRCRHSFHMTCLESWVMYKQLCPLCRGDIHTSEESE